MSVHEKGRAQDERWAEAVRERLGDPELPFSADFAAFEEIFAGRPKACGPPAVWRPEPTTTADSNPGRLAAEVGCDSFRELHRWSCRERTGYWERAIAALGIRFDQAPETLLDASGGPLHARWLPGARFNPVASCWDGVPADRPAVITGREASEELTTLTYGELRLEVERLAAGLAGLGVAAGDAVGLYLPLTADCAAAYLALAVLGARAVPVAESFPAPELRRRLALGEAKWVMTQSAFVRAGRRHSLYRAVREADAPPAVVLTPAGEPEPELRRGDRPWRTLLAARPRVETEPGPPDQVLNVLFSSGTTGTPKAIPWTLTTPLKCAADARYHHDVRVGDTVCWPTSIGWMMGPWLLWSALLNGATVALFEGAPTGREFVRFVARAGVSMLGTVPSLVRAWREAGAVGRGDWDQVRVLSSTGEPSNVADSLWLMSRTGYRAPVIEYCGGTEIGGGFLTGAVTLPASPGCFSTPALGLDVAVLDRRGRPVAEGGEGELFVVPPSIGLSERLLNADHEAQYHEGCPAGPGGAPLRRHGDRMRRLPGGFFRARGRTDDTMNLGGIKTSAVEIEQALAGDDAIAECAAVAVPDTETGADRLVLWVVPAAGSGTDTDTGTGPPAIDVDALREALGRRLRRELNPLFSLHDVVVVGSLPRTASNKLLRRTLRERYGRRTGRREEGR